MKGKNNKLQKIHTFRNWQESQKAKKTMKAYRWDFLFTLDKRIEYIKRKLIVSNNDL